MTIYELLDAWHEAHAGYGKDSKALRLTTASRWPGAHQEFEIKIVDVRYSGSEKEVATAVVDKASGKITRLRAHFSAGLQDWNAILRVYKADEQVEVSA